MRKHAPDQHYSWRNGCCSGVLLKDQATPETGGSLPAADRRKLSYRGMTESRIKAAVPRQRKDGKAAERVRNCGPPGGPEVHGLYHVNGKEGRTRGPADRRSAFAG